MDSTVLAAQMYCPRIGILKNEGGGAISPNFSRPVSLCTMCGTLKWCRGNTAGSGCQIKGPPSRRSGFR